MSKRIILGVVGVVLLIGGITLTFKDWIFIQMLFRGVIGPLLAVAGMVCLTMLKE